MEFQFCMPFRISTFACQPYVYYLCSFNSNKHICPRYNRYNLPGYNRPRRKRRQYLLMRLLTSNELQRHIWGRIGIFQVICMFHNRFHQFFFTFDERRRSIRSNITFCWCYTAEWWPPFRICCFFGSRTLFQTLLLLQHLHRLGFILVMELLKWQVQVLAVAENGASDPVIVLHSINLIALRQQFRIYDVHLTVHWH